MSEVWKPWQLADDLKTYGLDAGKWILVNTEDESEHENGVIYDTEEQAQTAAINANLREDDREPADDPDAWSGGFADNH